MKNYFLSVGTVINIDSVNYETSLGNKEKVRVHLKLEDEQTMFVECINSVAETVKEKLEIGMEIQFKFIHAASTKGGKIYNNIHLNDFIIVKK